jgi:hypothetical protein
MKGCGVGPEMRSGIFVLAFSMACVLPCRAQTAVIGSGRAPGATELDLPSYKAELTRIQESSNNTKELPELRRSLPEYWMVNNGARSYRVPTQEITDALAQIEHDPKKTALAKQLNTRFEAMRRHADDLALPAAGPTVAESEHKLKKILERGEFQAAASGPSAWDLLRARINRWIFDHILKLLGLLHISEKTGNAIAWGAIFLAVVWLFYVIYGWLSKASKGVQFRAEAEPMISDARHWVQEALAAAEHGDFREAIHCAYWASVARLEDIRILPRDRARTPREALRLLEHHPREQGGLQAITRKFELVWYGFRPASATDWAGAKEELEKMGCLENSTAPTVPS